MTVRFNRETERGYTRYSRMNIKYTVDYEIRLDIKELLKKTEMQKK